MALKNDFFKRTKATRHAKVKVHSRRGEAASTADVQPGTYDHVCTSAHIRAWFIL